MQSQPILYVTKTQVFKQYTGVTVMILYCVQIRVQNTVR